MGGEVLGIYSNQGSRSTMNLIPSRRHAAIIRRQNTECI